VGAVSFYDSSDDDRDSIDDQIIGGGCMSDTDILLLTLDSDAAGRRMVEHLLTCGSCNARAASLRRVLAEFAGQEELPTNSGRARACLDESALARLADGDEETSATRDEIAHLAGCARCRTELASLAALLADPGIAEARTLATRRFVTPHRPRRLQVLSALAAAAALLFLVRPAGERRTGSNTPAGAVHRAPTITALGSPRPLSPDGDVETAPVFSWTAAPGSDRYRLTLFDQAGHVVYETQVRDTSLALPDSVVLVRGVPYVWQVDARTGIDRWTSSEAAEFVLAARRRSR
jgi:hypothetical protein